MTNIQNTKKYDLEERTLDFGKRIIHLVKAIPKNTINSNLIDQIIRSGTSMGANYREANETETKKTFFLESEYVEKKEKKQYIGSTLLLKQILNSRKEYCHFFKKL